jgi:hypothetical protein
MKITVELSEKELKEVCRATGEKKKGPAIRKLVQKELMMRQRREFVRKCVAGEIGFEFKGYDEGKKLERKATERKAALWR